LQRELSAEQRDLQTKGEALAEGRRRTSDDWLAAKADELGRAAKELRDVVAELEQEVGEAIEDLDAQIKRLENAARTYRDEATRLRTEIARSSATITAAEGDGVEEELDTACAEEFRLNLQVEDYKSEVDGLRLLARMLRTAESEAKTRYWRR
jgi:chromosome segregation ATPase